MSVTIGKLVADYNSATFEERQRTKNIEVVPRELVIKVRTDCLEWMKDINDRLPYKQKAGLTHENGRLNVLEWVVKQIDAELAEFEEGEQG